MAGGRSTKGIRIIVGVIALGFLATGVAAVLWAQSGGNASRFIPGTEQPKVTWSENHIERTLSPSESTSLDLTFTSTLDLHGVTIEPVPTLAPFVSLVPNTFVFVPAGVPQPVHISINIPENSTLGAYDGTIHVRLAAQTVPDALKLLLRAWPTFRNPALGLSLKLPPHFSATSSTDLNLRQVVFSDNQDAVAPLLLLSILDTPPGQGIPAWVRSFGTGESEIQSVIIGGRQFSRWKESAGEGIEAINYSTALTNGRVLTVSTPSTAFEASGEFLALIASLELSEQ